MLGATQLLWTQIAAGVCLLLFAGSLYNLMRLRGRLAASKSWIKTDGEIIASAVKLPLSHTSDDQDDADAVIRYRYRVGGQNYESDSIKIGGQTSMARGFADALVAKYPVGARIDVHYDPRNPENAALEPHKQDNLVPHLVFAIVFGAIAGILAAHAIAGKVLYTDNGVPLFAFAFPIVAFLVAIFSVVSFVNGRRQAKASAQWPTASGTITTSDIVEEEIEDRKDDSNIVRIIRRYRVDLRYAYRVGRRDFVGTAWSWGWTPIYGLRELAEKVTGKYPNGQTVTVYYDPAQPDNAVLEPGNRQGSVAPLVFGGIFAVAGALILAFFVNVGFGH
jgi:Protein of unknown function (DUF3592)